MEHNYLFDELRDWHSTLNNIMQKQHLNIKKNIIEHNVNIINRTNAHKYIILTMILDFSKNELINLWSENWKELCESYVSNFFLCNDDYKLYSELDYTFDDYLIEIINRSCNANAVGKKKLFSKDQYDFFLTNMRQSPYIFDSKINIFQYAYELNNFYICTKIVSICDMRNIIKTFPNNNITELNILLDWSIYYNVPLLTLMLKEYDKFVLSSQSVNIACKFGLSSQLKFICSQKVIPTHENFIYIINNEIINDNIHNDPDSNIYHYMRLLSEYIVNVKIHDDQYSQYTKYVRYNENSNMIKKINIIVHFGYKITQSNFENILEKTLILDNYSDYGLELTQKCHDIMDKKNFYPYGIKSDQGTFIDLCMNHTQAKVITFLNKNPHFIPLERGVLALISRKYPTALQLLVSTRYINPTELIFSSLDKNLMGPAMKIKVLKKWTMQLGTICKNNIEDNKDDENDNNNDIPTECSYKNNEEYLNEDDKEYIVNPYSNYTKKQEINRKAKKCNKIVNVEKKSQNETYNERMEEIALNKKYKKLGIKLV